MSLDLNLVSDKLRRCRTRLQLSLSEVEEGTGIHLKKLELLEEGKKEPTGDEILILSDFYKEDYRFFISNQQKSASEQIDILYRKYGESFSKEDRWAIQEFLYLCECEQFIWEAISFRAKNFSFIKRGDFFKSHGIEAAKELRKFLGYSPKQLLSDIFDDFRSIGIHIFRRKLENSGISGLFIQHPIAGKCILVNFNEDVYRQNFTLAHEIGHSIFDVDEEFNVSFKNEKWDLREVRANTFASHYLLPEKAILDLRISNWSEEILHKIANQLKVNITPLLLRLKELKLIDKESYENFRRNYISRSSKEDFELEDLTGVKKENKIKLIEKGLSTFYVNKCYQAYSEGKISRSRLSEMLLTDDFNLPKILALFNLRLIYEY